MKRKTKSKLLLISLHVGLLVNLLGAVADLHFNNYGISVFNGVIAMLMLFALDMKFPLKKRLR